jgi:Ser/Thr protein kinase RdoA (MazF antagonist)
VELRQSLWRDLSAFGTSADRYGLIHADLVPENILVDGDALQVIDFDDAGYGWHLFEIATSLYFIRRDAIYVQARDAVIDGYRRHRNLSEEHLALLPMFLAARGTTYLGWVHTRAGEPVAAEMIPALIELATAVAEDYLNGRQ